MGRSQKNELQTLTLQSSVLVLLRTLYRMVLDYCVLRTSGDAGVVVFTKDQLISLIERSSPDMAIEDIPRLAARGLFKPVSIPNPRHLQVLVVGESGASVLSAEEALVSGDPPSPDWWEAPVPLALNSGGKLHFNPTALLMFSSDLKKMAPRDLPDKNEFMVELEREGNSRMFSFRRLEENVFLLEDCTDDIAAAEDISWWAAVGKAWVKKLEQEKQKYRRCEKDADLMALHTEGEVLPCEWDGELLGYFCVEEPVKNSPRSTTAAKQEKKEGPSTKKTSRRTSSSSPKTKTSAGDKNEPVVLTLGPQTLGLLAPGRNSVPSEEEAFEPKKKPLRRTEQKSGKGEKTKTNA